jgi:mono/diheme cytochrome c family protein
MRDRFRNLIPLLLVIAAGCQTAGPEADEDVREYDGRNLYLGYCASCHGTNGAGDGPVAAGMAFEMQDLRTLEARNGGIFPGERVRETIDGRTLRAVHGTNDMPVWGWQFMLEEESEAHVGGRIDALVAYLRSIQQDG